MNAGETEVWNAVDILKKIGFILNILKEIGFIFISEAALHR